MYRHPLLGAEDAMPKFHIHVCTAFEMVPDRVGRQCADRLSATKLAVRYARLLLAKPSYRHIDFKVLQVRDEFGNLVTSLPFRSPEIFIPVTASAGRFALNISNGRHSTLLSGTVSGLDFIKDESHPQTPSS